VSDDESLPIVDAPGELPPRKSLKTLTLQGVVWTLAGDGGSQIIRFVSNLILTRLLFPEVFGLMVVVTVVQQGLSMFSDVGIHPAIVQHRRGDDRVFLDTAWTISAIRGVLLCLVTALLSWPVARYTNEPSLIQLLPVVGLGTLAEGFLSTKVFTCDRHLSFGRLTLLNLGTSFVGLVVRIVWAWMSPTVWSLVAGGLSASILRVLLSHVLLPGPVNWFRWDRESLRQLASFGRWVFLSTILTFVSLQLDKIVFIKLIPLSMLGIYNIGSMLARLPLDTIHKIASSVAFPAFSRLQERQGNFESAYTRVRAPLLAGGGAMLGFLTLGGPLVVQILYPARYHDAGWIIQIVAVGMWFQVMESINRTAILALGLPKWLALGNFVKICFIAVALPLGYRQWGFVGALVAMTLVEIPKYLFEAQQVHKRGLKGWRVEWGITLALVVCAALAFGLSVWRPVGGGTGVKIALAAACYLAIWIPLLLWARRALRVSLSSAVGDRNPPAPGV
jgi:O-antigen/teichoic acid export membrane protein